MGVILGRSNLATTFTIHLVIAFIGCAAVSVVSEYDLGKGELAALGNLYINGELYEG